MEISLNYHYKTSGENAGHFEVDMILNPEMKPKDLVHVQEVITEKWIFDADVNLDGTSLVKQNQRICLTNFSNYIIHIPSPLVLCGEILKMICRDPMNCT